MTIGKRFSSITLAVTCWFSASVGSSLAATAQLTLTWTDNSTNESGFAIERKTGTTGSFAEIVRTAANVVTYTDAGLAAGTSYCYRVRAFNTTQYSAYSNESCSTTAVQSFTLTVNKGGTGSGTVSSTPAGISCGTDCAEAYSQGTTVTLTATPAAGAVFSGWSGACTGTGSCTVTLTANTAVTATFTSQSSYTLTVNKGGTGSGTVSSTPAGISCGTDCAEAYSQGTTVTLTATPAAGSVFSGWSEGSCGRNTTCTVNMTNNVTISASFITPPRLVAAYSFDEGSGTTVTDASGNNNTGTITEATWTTQGKFGKALSFNGTTSLVRINDANVLALANGMTLAAWVYPTVTPSGWRTLIVKEYIYVLYASAGSYDNKPLTWIGNDTHTSGGTSLPANTWTHVAATYDGVSIRLYLNGTQVASRAYSGQIPVSSDPLWIGGNGRFGEYFQGIIDEVRIYDQALSAEQIQRDMETPLGTPSPPQIYTLTVNKGGTGSGTVSSTPAGISCGTDCAEAYSQGTTVTLTATPAAGAVFSGWSGACTGTGSCTVTLTANTAVTATFNRSSLAFATNAGGPQYGAPDGTVYAADTAFSGGRTSTSSAAIARTDADPLYQSDRLGTFSYAIPVPNGTYSVTLHFAETYWSQRRKRIFNVSAEGRQVISKLDIYARVGKDTAYDVTVTVTVQDGTLNLNFSPLVGEAKVNAIKVAPASNTTTTTTRGQRRGGAVAGTSSVSVETRAAASPQSAAAKLGIFRPQSGLWQLDVNNNGTFDGCAEDACAGPFGEPGDLPVVGNRTDGGSVVLGVFTPGTGTWRLDANGNGVFDGCQVDRCLGPFGQPGDLPLVGDWTGTGTVKVGVFRPLTGVWELDLNGNGVFDGCQVDRCLGPFGQAGDLPLVGDWTGAGVAQLGLYDPRTGLVELDLNGNGVFDGCQVDRCLGPFGQPGDLVVVGEW